MAAHLTAEMLFRPDNNALRFLPEGPYPCGANRFTWVAIQHGMGQSVGSLNIFDVATKQNQSYLLPGRPGFAFATDRDGQFVIGCERSLGIFDIRDRSWRTFAVDIDKSVTNTIINDGVTFDGNLIFGCKDLEFKTKKAGLYLWRARDQRLITLRQDQICSNGKVILQRDNATWLIDIDSPTRQVVEYQLNVEAGTLGDPRVVLDFQGDPAVPDGMIITPDEQGLVISFFNPNPADHGETRQYDLASGELQKVWLAPSSPQCTCPQWIASQNGVILVFTSAAENMSEAQLQQSANAGCIFWSPTDYQTLPPSPVFQIPDALVR